MRMLSVIDIVYIVILATIIIYTILDKIVINKRYKNIIFWLLYLPISLTALAFAIYYIIETNRQGKLIESAIDAAKRQQIILESVINKSEEQKVGIINLMEDLKKQEAHIMSLIKEETIIKSFVFHVEYIFTSKQIISNILNPSGEHHAALIGIDNVTEISLISKWNMRYPDQHTAIYFMDFLPSNTSAIIGKPMSTLEMWRKARLPNPRHEFLGIAKGWSGVVVDPIYKLKISIFINGKICDSYSADIDSAKTKANTIIYGTKGGIFKNIETKYLKMMNL